MNVNIWVSYVLFDLPVGYPMGMDIRREWVRERFHAHDNTGMGMGRIFYPWRNGYGYGIGLPAPYPTHCHPYLQPTNALEENQKLLKNKPRGVNLANTQIK